jgi:nucleoside-diphosphate-sugar epimerase
MALHTILGASGPIGTELASLLARHTEEVRQLTPFQSATACPVVDLMNYEELVVAISGSEYVYMLMKPSGTAEWLSIIRNTVNACKENLAKLILLDDASYYRSLPGSLFSEDSVIYAAGGMKNNNIEATAFLRQEIAGGFIRAVVARSMDFYGPGAITNSILGQLVFARMAAGKRPVLPFNADIQRSFHYIPDIAKALYILAITPASTGMIWHLPAPDAPITGRKFVHLAARAMESNKSLMVWPGWRYTLEKWLDEDLAGLRDLHSLDALPMYYDSSRFQRAFRFSPTSYENGIKTTAAWYNVNR